jgi:hypothetical protein
LYERVTGEKFEPSDLSEEETVNRIKVGIEELI